MANIQEFVKKKTRNYTKEHGQIYYNINDINLVLQELLKHYNNAVIADKKAGSCSVIYDSIKK